MTNGRIANGKLQLICHFLRGHFIGLIKTNPTTHREVMSIIMKTDNLGRADMIEKLEAILALLDDSGHSIAAIKIEEAINALKRSENESKTSNKTL